MQYRARAFFQPVAASQLVVMDSGGRRLGQNFHTLLGEGKSLFGNGVTSAGDWISLSLSISERLGEGVVALLRTFLRTPHPHPPPHPQLRRKGSRTAVLRPPHASVH